MKTLFALALLFVSLFSAAEGSADYFCIERDAGGLKYSAGAWLGTGFNTSDKWQVKQGKDKTWEVIQFGQGESFFTCKVGEFKKDQLACLGVYGSFRLDFESLRFVATADFGFDVSTKRPGSLTVGTGICTKS